MSHNHKEGVIKLECLPNEIILEVVDYLLASDDFNTYEDAKLSYPDEDGTTSRDPHIIHDCSLLFPGTKAATRFGSACKRLHAIIDPYVIRHDIRHHDASCLLLPAKRGYARGVAKALAHGANADALDCTVFDIFYTSVRDTSTYYCGPTKLNLTAIHWAAFFGYTDIVALLLRHSADVRKRADLGLSSCRLTHALYGSDGYSALGSRHIQCGMLSHTQDEYGWAHTLRGPSTAEDDPEDGSAWYRTRVGANALFYALKACPNADVREEWNPCKRYRNDDRPIVMADESGCRLAMARMLIESGVSLTTRTKDRVHALHQACAYRDVDIVQFLVELGVDVNVTDANGYTALHYMAMNTLYRVPHPYCYGYHRINYPQGSEGRILRLLLDHGIDLYRLSNKGFTAMNLGLDVAHTVPFTEAYLPGWDCGWSGRLPYSIESCCAGPCYSRHPGTRASEPAERHPVTYIGEFDPLTWG